MLENPHKYDVATTNRKHWSRLFKIALNYILIETIYFNHQQLQVFGYFRVRWYLGEAGLGQLLTNMSLVLDCSPTMRKQTCSTQHNTTTFQFRTTAQNLTTIHDLNCSAYWNDVLEISIEWHPRLSILTRTFLGKILENRCHDFSLNLQRYSQDILPESY